MKEKLNSKPLTGILLLVLFGIIGGTIAYYQTSDTFTNEFDTGKYVIKTEETFESPPNWTPGDTTPKEVTVKNEGDVKAVVKICLTEKWEDASGNTLPLFDSNYEFAALVEFDPNYDLFWLTDCNNNDDEGQRCYYYYKVLDPGETTEALLQSVTYNPYFDFESTTTCTTDPVTHKQTCIIDLGGYSGGKYTLNVNVETVQYSHYEDAWPNAQISKNNSCEPLTLRSQNLYHNLLMANTAGNNYNVFGSGLTHYYIESLEIKDNMNIPVDAIRSWDVSALQNGSVMAWVTDVDSNSRYELYIGANGKVVANPNSSFAFNQLTNVKKLDITNLDTSQVENMNNMFEELGRNIFPSDNPTYIGFENLDTSNVTTMDAMFAQTTMGYVTIDFSNWDTSNLTSACNMFYSSQMNHIGIGHISTECHF